MPTQQDLETKLSRNCQHLLPTRRTGLQVLAGEEARSSRMRVKDAKDAKAQGQALLFDPSQVQRVDEEGTFGRGGHVATPTKLGDRAAPFADRAEQESAGFFRILPLRKLDRELFDLHCDLHFDLHVGASPYLLFKLQS